MDAEFIQTVERDGQQAAFLGDPGQDCLHDKRGQSRRRVRNTVDRDASVLAQNLGLSFVGVTRWDTLRQMAGDPYAGEGLYREFRNLRQSDLIIEATEGDVSHYIVVETPFRAFGTDIDWVQRNARVIAAVTGRSTHAVIASVRKDSSLDGQELPDNIRWHMVDEADLEPE